MFHVGQRYKKAIITQKKKQKNCHPVKDSSLLLKSIVLDYRLSPKVFECCSTLNGMTFFMFYFVFLPLICIFTPKTNAKDLKI